MRYNYIYKRLNLKEDIMYIFALKMENLDLMDKVFGNY